MLFDIFILFSVSKCVVKKWICGPSQNCWKWYEQTKLRVRKRRSFYISDLILSRGLQTKTYLFTLSPFCRLYLRSCWWPRARRSADSQEIGVFTFQPGSFFTTTVLQTLHQPAFQSHPPSFSRSWRLRDTWTPSLATGPLQKRASRPSPIDNHGHGRGGTDSQLQTIQHTQHRSSVHLPSFLSLLWLLWYQDQSKWCSSVFTKK